MLIKKALKLSMESDTSETELDKLSLEEHNQMIDNGPQDAKDAEDGFYKLSEAAASLEEIQDLLTQSEKEGGLVPQAAQAVGIALEHIHNSLGLSQPELGLSLEDFESDERENSTKTVGKSVSETLEKVWKTILEFVDKIIKWFKQFIYENFNSMGILNKRADKIKDALAYVKEFKVTEVKNKSLCTRLYSPDVKESGIVPAYADAMATIANSFSAGDEADVGQKIETVSGYLKGGTQYFEQATKAMLDACDSYAKNVFGNNTTKRAEVPEAPEGGVVYSTPTILGGIGWYYIKPKTEEDFGVTKIASYRCEEGSYEEVRSFGKTEIQHVIASFKTMDKIHHASKKNLENLAKIRRGFSMAVNSTTVNLSHGGFTGNAKQIQPIVRTILKLMIGITGSSYTHLVRISKDMFSLCEISMDLGEQHEMSKSRDLARV